MLMSRTNYFKFRVPGLYSCFLRRVSVWMARKFAPDLVVNFDLSREIDSLTIKIEKSNEIIEVQDRVITKLKKRLAVLEVTGE